MQGKGIKDGLLAVVVVLGILVLFGLALNSCGSSGFSRGDDEEFRSNVVMTRET